MQQKKFSFNLMWLEIYWQTLKSQNHRHQWPLTLTNLQMTESDLLEKECQILDTLIGKYCEESLGRILV